MFKKLHPYLFASLGIILCSCQSKQAQDSLDKLAPTIPDSPAALLAPPADAPIVSDSKTEASISSLPTGQQARVTHWASPPLKAKSKEEKHPFWNFEVKGVMKDIFDDEILNFSYILIKRIPRSGGAGEIVARIDRSEESLALIEALRQCKYTLRHLANSDVIFDFAYYDFLEFYNEQSKCILSLSSRWPLSCFTTKNGNHRSLLDEFLLFSQSSKNK